MEVDKNEEMNKGFENLPPRFYFDEQLIAYDPKKDLIIIQCGAAYSERYRCVEIISNRYSVIYFEDPKKVIVREGDCEEDNNERPGFVKITNFPLHYYLELISIFEEKFEDKVKIVFF